MKKVKKLDKNGIPIENYNSEKIWVPFGYVRSIFDKFYRRYPNPEKGYTEWVIQNVNLDKSNDDGIVCDLIKERKDSITTCPDIYISHKQISTFMGNQEKAMLYSYNKSCRI